LRVGVDLDGVCFDFSESLLAYMKYIGLDQKYDLEMEHTHWHFYRDWGMTDEEFVRLCNDGADAGWLFSGGYRDNAPEALRKIKRLGHSIHIITDRGFGSSPEVSQTITRGWLDRWDIPYDTLTFSRDKTSVPTDVFVEDKLENYDALWAAGTYCYLVDRPWNQDDSRLRKRIRSIEEYATLIENNQYLARTI